MSKPKVGDRVRVVIEAEVNSTSRGGWIGIQGCGHFRESEFGVVSIEVITPPFVLPTKRWAQVAEKRAHVVDEILWTLEVPLGSAAAYWVDTAGMPLSPSDLLKHPNLRVISEGVDDE